MAEVFFYMPRVPRTVTREEWYKAWRRVRVLKKETAALNKITAEQLHNPALPQRIKKDIMDNLIYPPLILGPYMDFK